MKAPKGTFTAPPAPASTTDHTKSSRATRETIESIVVAIILAFLFRSFVAEAFVIPTGSMAPTLQGSHKDVQCEQCDYWYRAGASIENDDGQGGLNDYPSPRRNRPKVVGTTCPLCRYTMVLHVPDNPAHSSFTGDRILVSKFAYEIGDPQRWDVIVFKYPLNAKQNFIKRLIGLPNETVRIFHGDIYVKGPHEEQFHIERKPEHKLDAMLQTVSDTSHLSSALKAAGWPSSWQPETLPEDAGQLRALAEDEDGFQIDSRSGAGDANVSSVWLRYRHFLPSASDWEDVEQTLEHRGFTDPEEFRRRKSWRGNLITDYYAYNDFTTNQIDTAQARDTRETLGTHWVGDLAIDCEVEVQSDEGVLLLDLVEGGAHYLCAIDVKTGIAELKINDADWNFDDADEMRAPRAETSLQGRGTYQIRFANVDNQLRLWIDEDLASFNRPTTFDPPARLRPVWNESNPGDLAPAGIGGEGIRLHVHRAQLLRDVYYVATEERIHQPDAMDYEGEDTVQSVLSVLSDPTQWEETDLFARRRAVEFTLGADEFFPLGDNSPESKDARLWGYPASVDRELLTGKALLIYWPHSWNRPIPYFPNFSRMGLIR